MKEIKTRSIIKTISWRIIATLITIGIVYIFTGNLPISLGVGSVEVITKMFFYYAHERTWANVKWGIR